MKFLADECCDAYLVRGLRQDGHDVRFVAEFSPGADDERLLQVAVAEQRILLTEDKDFGELVVRLGYPTFGIVLLRMTPVDSITKLARLRDVLRHQSSRLAHAFVVVEHSTTRFRSLDLP